MTITRNLIDGSLLAKAKDGNRRAIREVLGHLEESLRPLAGQDEVIEWLLGAVRRIRDGEDPNAAFAWSPNGRPSECLELERWNWARWRRTPRPSTARPAVRRAGANSIASRALTGRTSATTSSNPWACIATRCWPAASSYCWRVETWQVH